MNKKLKKTLTLVGALILVVLFAVALFASPPTLGSRSKETSELSVQQVRRNVVICNGNHSTRYHRIRNCRGLSNCRGGLSTITLQEARRRGRTACQICF